MWSVQIQSHGKSQLVAPLLPSFFNIILFFFSFHKAAQNAQKESVVLFQSLFFQDLPEDDERRNCDAVIFSLRANGVLVFVPR